MPSWKCARVTSLSRKTFKSTQTKKLSTHQITGKKKSQVHGPIFPWLCHVRPLLVSFVFNKPAGLRSLHSQLRWKSPAWGSPARARLPVVATVAQLVRICTTRSQHTEHRITGPDGQRNTHSSKGWTHVTFLLLIDLMKHFWPWI